MFHRLGTMALVLLFILVGHGWAQVPITITLHTAQSANTSGASAPAGNYDDAVFVVTGTFTGNVNFQVLNSGGQIQALQCRQQGNGAMVTQGTVADTYECLLPGGATTVQAPTTGMTSGSVTVTLQLTFAYRQRFGQLLLGPTVTPILNNCLVGNGTTWGSATCGPSTGVTGPVKDKGGAVYNVSAYGAACDGVTDDSTVFSTLLTTVSNAGGGTIVFPAKTCVLNSCFTFPNDGATPPNQKAMRITGANPSHNGQAGAPNGGTILLVGCTSGQATFDTRGLGYLEIDHLTFQESSASSTVPFVFTTNTTLHIHDTEFFGSTTKSGTTCNQDALVLGGTGTVSDGSTTAPFQGYGTVIAKNYFNRIRRAALFQTYANAIPFRDNTVWNLSGSDQTTAITAATNANPAVLTVTAHGFPSTLNSTLGPVVKLTLGGFTGNWTPLNGLQTITYVSANTFSVPIDSTTFGALTGTPVYNSGAVLEFNGNAGSNDSGDVIVGNLFEVTGYAVGIKAVNASLNTFTDNGFFDPTTKFYAAYHFFPSSSFNMVRDGFRDDSKGNLMIDAPLANTAYTAHQNQNTYIAQPMTFANNATWINQTHPTWLDVPSGNTFLSSMINSTSLVYNFTPSGGAAETAIAFVRNSSTTKTIALGDGNQTTVNVAMNGGTGDVKIKAGTGGSVWLGDAGAQQIYVNANMLNFQNTTFPSLRFANTGGTSWSSTTSPSGSNDVGIARHAAGVLEANNGTQGAFNGDFGARGLGVGTAPNGQNVIAFLNFVFANIGTVLTANGQIGYCSDCTIANPCAGSGTGAIAKRLNGVNVCN